MCMTDAFDADGAGIGGCGVWIYRLRAGAEK